jgi:hypothetical protein
VWCCNRVASQMTPGPEGRHNNCRWRQPPVGKDEFFYSLLPPGPVGPGKRCCRPSGAGVAGKHLVCCCNRVASQLTPGPESRHNNCRWRQPPVGKDEFLDSLLPSGPVGPGKRYCRPSGAGALGKHPVWCCNQVASQMTPGPEGRHSKCRWRQPPVGKDEFLDSLLPGA